MGRGAESERVGLFRAVTPGEGRESGWGRSSGLREMADPTERRLFLNSSGPEPQGPGFSLSAGKRGGCLLEEPWTAGCR